MKRWISAGFLCLFLLMPFLCMAAAVPLNDTIKEQQFIKSFNNCAKRENLSYRLVREPKYNRTETEEGFLSSFVIEGVHPHQNLILVWSGSESHIYAIHIFIDSPERLKDMIGETMIIEHALGMPGGEAQSDGMFAIVDAIKKGKGSYWSEATQRRYIIEYFPPEGEEETLLEIRADV